MAAEPDSSRSPLHGTSGYNVTSHPSPRHVWVTVTGITADKHVGILLDWRRGKEGWEALVVWAAGGGRQSAHTRLEWLHAHHVEPR